MKKIKKIEKRRNGVKITCSFSLRGFLLLCVFFLMNFSANECIGFLFMLIFFFWFFFGFRFWSGSSSWWFTSYIRWKAKNTRCSWLVSSIQNQLITGLVFENMFTATKYDKLTHFIFLAPVVGMLIPLRW